jgi:hypothetical protein
LLTYKIDNELLNRNENLLMFLIFLSILLPFSETVCASQRPDPLREFMKELTLTSITPKQAPSSESVRPATSSEQEKEEKEESDYSYTPTIKTKKDRNRDSAAQYRKRRKKRETERETWITTLEIDNARLKEENALLKKQLAVLFNHTQRLQKYEQQLKHDYQAIIDLHETRRKKLVEAITSPLYISFLKTQNAVLAQQLLEQSGKLGIVMPFIMTSEESKMNGDCLFFYGSKTQTIIP